MNNDCDKNNLADEIFAVKKASEITQVYDNQNKRLWIAIIALTVALILMAGCMVWAAINAQTIANNAMWEALNTVAEMEVVEETTTTTTTTTEVVQDTGEGSGNNVYLDGDGTIYNEGGE